MARFPLVLPALCLIAGVLAERADDALVALVLAVGFATIGTRFRLLAAFTGCGIVLGALHGHPPRIDREMRSVTVTGVVVDRERKPTGTRFPFATDNGPALRVMLPLPVAIGERLTLRGRLTPFDEPRNPGEMDLRAFEAARGLAGELQRPQLIARHGFAPPTLPLALARLRDTASSILRLRIAEPQASILAGALYGERGTIPHDLHDDFQVTGTVHVLVTAGLHLGIVAASALAFLRFTRLPRVASCLATFAIVWVYAAFSGDHLPSVRAATMISVVLLGRAIGARAATGNAIATAAILVAVLLTPDVGTTSFWLSFACVSSIVLFASPIADALERMRWIPEPVAEAFALTIATQIGVLPLTLATFFTLAPYAVVANAFVVPLIGIAMIGGWCVLAASAFHHLALALGLVETRIIDAIVFVVRTIAALPGARLALAPPHPLCVALDAGLAFAAAILLRRNRKRAAIACIVAGIALVTLTPRSQGTNIPAMTMLDVGQGDAIVVRSKAGRTLLIDTGGRLERGSTSDGNSPAEAIGERVVVPALLRMGITHLDAIVLTHPHGDHAGGLAPILRTLSVDRILDSGQRYGGHAYRDGMKEAARRHVPVEIARCGDRLRLDNVSLEVLSPCGSLLNGGRNDVNENSLVVRIAIGGERILLMGDAGAQTESVLLRRGVDLRADILKVGHHGSAYASSPGFIAAIRPRLALISVGRHNLFGHPSERTLAMLHSTGSTVYRTDRCGAIEVDAPPAQTVHTAISCEAAAIGPARSL